MWLTVADVHETTYELEPKEGDRAWCSREAMKLPCLLYAGDKVEVNEGDYEVHTTDGFVTVERMLPCACILHNVTLTVRDKDSVNMQYIVSITDCADVAMYLGCDETLDSQVDSPGTELHMEKVLLKGVNVVKYLQCTAEERRPSGKKNIEMRVVPCNLSTHSKLEDVSNSARFCFMPVSFLGTTLTAGDAVRFEELVLSYKFVPRVGYSYTVDPTSVVQKCSNSVTTVLFDKQLTFKDLCKDPSLVELRMADDERPYACRIPAKLLCDVFGANAVEDFRGGETLKFAMIEMDQGTINKAIGSRIRTMDGKKQRDKVTRVKGELMEVVERSDEGLYDALEIDHCFWEVLRPTLYILSYTASLDEPLQKLGGNDDLFQGLVAGVRKLATEKDTILRSNIPNNDKEAALEAAHTVFRAVDRLKLKPSMQTTLVRWGLENLREEVTDPQPVGVQDQAAVAWERKQHKLQHQLDVMQCMPVDEYIRNKKHDPNDDPW